MPTLLPSGLPTFLLLNSYSVRSLSSRSVRAAELSPGLPRLTLSTYLACLMAPSRVLKRAPHSSTTQWKCTLWRKSHCASQKSLVPNLAKAEKQPSYRRPQKRSSVGRDVFSLFFNSTTILFSNITVPAAQTALLALLLDYCLLHRPEQAEQEPNFSPTELDRQTAIHF